MPIHVTNDKPSFEDGRIPYTYYIKQKDTGYFYYGVKYGKDANPSTFWIDYFTSSKNVHILIEKYGLDSFETKIITIHTSIEEALQEELQLIRETRDMELSLNISAGGDGQRSHKCRLITDKNGLNSYQRAGIKLRQFLQTPYWREVCMPISIAKTKHTKSTKIGADGLTVYQRSSILFQGDNNPSKNPEVKIKISNSVKKWITENPENVAINIKKSKEVMKTPDEFGLNSHDYHSIKMKTPEVNKAIDSCWYIDGIKDIRLRAEDEIPAGFKIGRTKNMLGYKYEQVVCPYCGTIGSGGNMKRYHFEACKHKPNESKDNL